MNYSHILKEIYEEIKHFKNDGEVASYIPELKKADSNKHGVCLKLTSGKEFYNKDSNEKFSIQSIVKVLALAKALSLKGNQIWDRVGVEPSGNPFNSLIQLELENGIPRNPFINAGAIVIADILYSNLENPAEDFLSFIREIANDKNKNINYNFSVAKSEKEVGYRNIAIGNFLKSFGNIHNDIDAVLDFYFLSCSIEMNCHELASSFLFLANGGNLLHNKKKILTLSQAKRINALMQSCGFYDESGEFTFKVGIPGKSGVGGGIIALHPGDYSVAVWSPKLNKKGNSVLGLKTLELLTTKTGHSIF